MTVADFMAGRTASLETPRGAWRLSVGDPLDLRSGTWTRVGTFESRADAEAELLFPGGGFRPGDLVRLAQVVESEGGELREHWFVPDEGRAVRLPSLHDALREVGSARTSRAAVIEVPRALLEWSWTFGDDWRRAWSACADAHRLAILAAAAGVEPLALVQAAHALLASERLCAREGGAEALAAVDGALGVVASLRRGSLGSPRLSARLTQASLAVRDTRKAGESTFVTPALDAAAWLLDAAWSVQQGRDPSVARASAVQSVHETLRAAKVLPGPLGVSEAARALATLARTRLPLPLILRALADRSPV